MLRKQTVLLITLGGAIILLASGAWFLFAPPTKPQTINNIPSSTSRVPTGTPATATATETPVEATTTKITAPQSVRTNLKRQEITREDIIKENWPYTVPRLDYSVDYSDDWKNIVLRDSSRGISCPLSISQPPIFIGGANADAAGKGYLLGENRIEEATATSSANQLPHKSGPRGWRLYEVDVASCKIREILSAKETIYKPTLRFSLAQETIDFMTYAIDTVDDTKVHGYFNIVDLTTPSNSLKIELPDVKLPDKNIREFERDLLKQNPREAIQDIKMLVGAYRFPNNDSVEFTTYYGVSSTYLYVGFMQISDKELWSYNKKSGKLTLLETIPFKGATTTPAN